MHSEEAWFNAIKIKIQTRLSPVFIDVIQKSDESDLQLSLG